jgi:hypothetical protein
MVSDLHDAVAVELQRRSTALPQRLPMTDSPSALLWESLMEQAGEHGAAELLLEQFVQLRLPIAAGISQSPEYLAMRLPGGPPAIASSAAFAAPSLITLDLADSLAGRIPVITCGTRADFEVMVRAIVHCNEPAAVPASMGACLVSGYTNWTRVHAARSAVRFTAAAASAPPKDQFIILSQGAYSAVPASQMEMSEAHWSEVSLALRRHHELAHYLCKRSLGEMRNALLDELAADYAAITTVRGEFSGMWLRRFLGVEHHPEFRPGGRLANYGAAGHRTAEEMAELQRLAVLASETLEGFERQRVLAGGASAAPVDLAWATLAIVRTGLAALCGTTGVEELFAEWRGLRAGS